MWYTNVVKIPDKEYYVKHHDRSGEPDLSFMVPFGTDKSYLKRKETADSWASGNWYRQPAKKNLVSDIIDNKPIAGFKLTFDIRNGYKGSPDAWRVRDPRGFVVEIRSDNLAQLMKFTKIENGDIHGECVWGREGPRNVLLSVNTEDYKNAVQNTTNSKTVNSAAGITMKNVAIGNIVILEKGEVATYLGQMQVFNRTYSYGEPFFKISMRYVFHIPQTDPKERYCKKGTLYERASLKVVKITDTKTMTADEAEAFANKMVKDNECGNQSEIYLAKGVDYTYSFAFEYVETVADFIADSKKKDRERYSFAFEYVETVADFIADSKKKDRERYSPYTEINGIWHSVDYWETYDWSVPRKPKDQIRYHKIDGAGMLQGLRSAYPDTLQYHRDMTAADYNVKLYRFKGTLSSTSRRNFALQHL